MFEIFKAVVTNTISEGFGFKKLKALGCSSGVPGALDSCVVKLYCAGVATNAAPAVHPGIQTDEQTGSSTELETGYLVICWNDPINLMDYVTHVFQVVFGWERKKAERHMLEVHKLGKSVLARESLEKADSDINWLLSHCGKNRAQTPFAQDQRRELKVSQDFTVPFW